MIDRLIGLICALLGAGAIWHAQTLHVPFAADPVGPRVFPTITGGVLILGGFILMLRPGAVTLDVYVCNLGADNSAKARALLAALQAAFAPLQAEHHQVQRGAVA